MSALTPQLLVNYIRYSRLSFIIANHYRGNRSTKVNLFIDLKSLLNLRMFSNRESVEYSKEELISLILNMTAHYKAFFKTLNVSIKSFLVYPRIPINSFNKTVCPDYWNEPYTDFYQNLISESIDDIKTICMYLPDVYFIDPIAEESAIVIYDILTKIKTPHVENIILTKDVYNYQMVNFDCLIIRPMIGGKAYGIDRNNLWEVYMQSRVKNYDSYKNINISTELLSFIWALSGLSQRSIKSTLRINTVIKLLETNIKYGLINNGYTNDIGLLLDIIMPNIDKVIDKGVIINNFIVLDVIQQYMTFYNSSMLLYNIDKINNPAALRELNMIKFPNYPLDLERI